MLRFGFKFFHDLILLLCFTQLDELKKSVDERQIVVEEGEAAKKRLQQEVEGLLQREENLLAKSSRLEKSKNLEEKVC